MITKPRGYGFSNALRCSGVKPHICLRRVSQDALSSCVSNAQIDLRAYLTLPGGQGKPFDRLAAITRESIAVEIHQPDIALRHRISLPRERQQKLYSFGILTILKGSVSVAHIVGPCCNDPAKDQCKCQNSTDEGSGCAHGPVLSSSLSSTIAERIKDCRIFGAQARGKIMYHKE